MIGKKSADSDSFLEEKEAERKERNFLNSLLTLLLLSAKLQHMKAIKRRKI